METKEVQTLRVDWGYIVEHPDGTELHIHEESGLSILYSDEGEALEVEPIAWADAPTPIVLVDIT